MRAADGGHGLADAGKGRKMGMEVCRAGSGGVGRPLVRVAGALRRSQPGRGKSWISNVLDAHTARDLAETANLSLVGEAHGHFRMGPIGGPGNPWPCPVVSFARGMAGRRASRNEASRNAQYSPRDAGK